MCPCKIIEPLWPCKAYLGRWPFSIVAGSGYRIFTFVSLYKLDLVFLNLSQMYYWLNILLLLVGLMAISLLKLNCKMIEE